MLNGEIRHSVWRIVVCVPNVVPAGATGAVLGNLSNVKDTTGVESM